jgi:hypothetical protein
MLKPVCNDGIKNGSYIEGVAGNILEKHYQRVDKGWFCTCRIRRGINSLILETITACYEFYLSDMVNISSTKTAIKN